MISNVIIFGTAEKCFDGDCFTFASPSATLRLYNLKKQLSNF